MELTRAQLHDMFIERLRAVATQCEQIIVDGDEVSALVFGIAIEGEETLHVIGGGDYDDMKLLIDALSKPEIQSEQVTLVD